MAENKYLDLTGLTTYDEKLKEKMASDDASILQQGKSYADSLSTNYDAAGTAETKVQELANGQVTTNKNNITALQSGKADKATTLSGYGITDAYTKTQTDSAIATAVANADHLKREIVEDLPEVDSADEHTIYMVAKASGSGEQKYDEYMLINGAFEKVGDSAVDLTNYATKTEVSTAKSEAISTAASDATTKANQALSDAKTYADGLADNYATAAQGAKADTALQQANITTGGVNGTIAVKGTDVAVKGLGSAAYTASSAYATAAQGAKADSALQKADITSGSGNGTIAVDGADVTVKGLASAAYKVAGSASGNVPVTGADLGNTANVPVVTNASGQLIPHASGALGTAAFAAATAFDAAGTANTLVTNLSNGQVTTNKNDIATMKSQISDLQAGVVTAITDEEIEALFA